MRRRARVAIHTHSASHIPVNYQIDNPTDPPRIRSSLRMRRFRGMFRRMTKPKASIQAKAAEARWRSATHRGTIKLLDTETACFVLDDGRRVLSNNGMVETLAMKGGGAGQTALGNDRLLRFARGKIVSQYLPADVLDAIENPIKFRVGDEETRINGYEASLLVALCQAVLKARDEGKLQRQQEHIAHRCYLLILGFANLGLVALIDEATGYQSVRARDALAEILEAFIAKDLAAWVKTFPDDFYLQLARLCNVKLDAVTSQRPQYFGHHTNNIVYERLAPGVREELQRTNPRQPNGNRKAKHHQWMTRDIGHPKLREHITKVVVLMQIAKDWQQFITNLDVVAPRVGETLTMPFMARQ
jgi:hypothetical protein